MCHPLQNYGILVQQQQSPDHTPLKNLKWIPHFVCRHTQPKWCFSLSTEPFVLSSSYCKKKRIGIKRKDISFYIFWLISSSTITGSCIMLPFGVPSSYISSSLWPESSVSFHFRFQILGIIRVISLVSVVESWFFRVNRTALTFLQFPANICTTEKWKNKLIFVNT